MGITGHADPGALLEKSSVVFSSEEVMAALDNMADEINDFYGGQSIVLLGVMTGGSRAQSIRFAASDPRPAPRERGRA